MGNLEFTAAVDRVRLNVEVGGLVVISQIYCHT